MRNWDWDSISSFVNTFAGIAFCAYLIHAPILWVRVFGWVGIGIWALLNTLWRRMAYMGVSEQGEPR